MIRHCVLFLLLLTLSIAALAAGTTVVVNGKTVTVPVMVVDGKAYADVAALMQILGGKATYDAATNKLVVNSTGTATTPPTTSGGGSTGTVQLAGDNGVLGNVYSICKGSPLYFSLKSAEYTTKQVVIGNSLTVPKAGEKLLLLHFSVQNPQKTERFVRFDSLRLTAIDAMNVNHECTASWGDADSHQPLEISLKPAQHIDVYTAIAVPAKGIVPKLMVQSPNDTDGPVLRYDLHDKVTALAAPIADPADAAGATALETVPGQAGTAYPYGNFDITVEKFATTTDTLENGAPEDGASFQVVTLLMKNQAPSESFLRWDTITAALTGADGEELKYNSMLFASANRSFEQNVKPGQQVRVRIYFTVPKGSTPKTLALKEGESRTYEFEVK